MRVLITGCSGFLGHHIIKECEWEGWETIGVDKRPIPKGHNIPSHFIQTDVRDLIFRDLMGIDYVIHLAWRTNIPNCMRHPEESTYQNIDMTMHLVEVCKEAKVKKIFFPSTASLYGNNPTPWKEDMPVSPIEPYSWQKLSCEYLLKMNEKELPYAIGRFFQVFGEFQREDTALAHFIKCKKEGKPVTLTETMAQSKFKSGQRDFIYAGDVAKAVITLLEKGEGIYNVASGQVRTMEEIAKALKSEVVWLPRRPYECERHEANVDKLKALGWSPQVEVLDWLKKYEG